MKTHFSKSFLKDIQKINDSGLKKRIKEVIINLEACSDIYEMKDIKKLKGYPNAFQVRIQDFRLGLFVFDGEITVKRFVKRNDIFKVFP